MKRLRIDWIDYQGPNSTIESFISSSQSELLGWEIFFNKEIKEAEAWFVIEGAGHSLATASIPRGMLFFGTGDTIWTPDFFNKNSWRLEFLNQFNQIYSCHEIALPQAKPAIPFHHWMINANTGTNTILKHKRDYDFLVNLEPPEKKRELSVICSTKGFTRGHANRLKFVEGLKEHFGERIDWFGNGKFTVAEKWDALVDYKYTIAIENSTRPDVITEKILDPYLSYTFPIYSGAPNLQKYFDRDSYLSIDIENLDASILKIEKLLEEDKYFSQVEILGRQRDRVLNDYNFVQRIIRIAEEEFRKKETLSYENTDVKPMSNFQPLKSKLRNRLSGILFTLKTQSLIRFPD